MPESLLVFVPHEQTHRALSILEQVGMLGPELRAVKIVMKLIANSPSTAKVAPMEIAQEAGHTCLAQWAMHLTLP